MARRVLALILLGLVLIVCVVLAASESLTNRTGRTATAVTVTFSEQVRITSYDEAVFPTKDPSSRADTFRFSGGQLENGARFSVSWTPSTAEITSTEWETTGAASSASTGSSAPLTYEAIMAQIAHYPGPDEPRYVPADGEQIWLTDLEGHADIYDNDSIRINYAPGFDKSQVTWIGVYRNGIKMRFLPTLFDVVTNEQMKTFDGNPEEHTPKSSHSDHAIFGYEYEFRLTVGTATKAVRAVVRSPVTALGETFVTAQAPSYLLYRYGDAELLAVFKQWKHEGFAGAQFSNYYFMDSMAGTELFAQYEYNEQILESFFRTATPDEVRRWLRLCREAGLKAELRIEIWMTKAVTAQGGNRSSIAPRSWARWFESYTAICVEAARLAEEMGCSAFTPLVELDTCMMQTDRVKKLLEDITAVFSGRLCVSWASCLALGSSASEWATYWAHEGPSFWDWTGRGGPVEVGIEWWGEPTRGLETQKDQRLSVLLASFVALNSRLVSYLRGMYPQTPIRFCEIGAWNADGASLPGFRGWESPAGLAYDYQEFADSWAAFMLGASFLGIDVAAWTRTMDAGFMDYWPPGALYMNGTPATRIVSAFLQ